MRGCEENMKKTLEKIFTLASVVVAVILIMVLIVTAFGGIKDEDFDNNLVKGLLFTLGILYLVLSIVAIVLVFVNSDVLKEVALKSEQGGSVKVSAHVITKYVKNACAQVEGVKCKKVTLVSDEYGVRLKADVKVVNKDVIEVETYLRTLLEDMFLNEFNFKFNSIEFKVTALVPKYEADQAAIDAAVAKKLADMKAERKEDEELVSPEAVESDESPEEVAPEEEEEEAPAVEIEDAPVEEAAAEEEVESVDFVAEEEPSSDEDKID